MGFRKQQEAEKEINGVKEGRKESAAAGRKKRERARVRALAGGR